MDAFDQVFGLTPMVFGLAIVLFLAVLVGLFVVAAGTLGALELFWRIKSPAARVVSVFLFVMIVLVLVL